MSDLLFIEQTLHGYLDGHQLLAGSIELSPAEQSLLLIMSDLSGPAFRSGYESYLTGYSLVNSPYYCIAKTWFAPELPRPGCVWTQTFLIRAEDLARISNFDHLNQLFSRPENLTDFSWFKQRVVMDLLLAPTPRVPPDGLQVLRGLYGTDKRIVIPAENSSTFEPLVLGLFEQQWPRLRRSLKFCTGALSLRDTEFDISVSPPEVTFAVSDTGLVMSEKPAGAAEDEEGWTETAGQDYIHRQAGTPLREFLWRFGPDHVDGRGSFRPLVEIFSVLSSQDDFRGDKLLSATSYFYPGHDSAARLKKELFGPGGRLSQQIGAEKELLRLLVTHPNTPSLPIGSMMLAQRATELSKQDPSAATDIAITASEMGGIYAEQFLEGYLSNTEWADEILRTVPAILLLKIIEKHSSLIARNTIWSRDDKNDLTVRLLTALSADETVLRSALISMIEAAAWNAVLFILRNLNYRSARAIFSYVDDEGRTSIDIPDLIICELAEYRDVWGTLIENQQLGARSLRMLSSELDPRAWSVRRIDLSNWLKLLGAPATFDNKMRELKSWVFCLSLGLSSESNGADKLVCEAFGAVYEAGLRDALNGKLWEELEPNLTWYNPSWDKCARLVRSAALAFYERPWDKQMFLRTFIKPELLAPALKEIDKKYYGYRYIRELREAANAGQLVVSDGQRKILLK